MELRKVLTFTIMLIFIACGTTSRVATWSPVGEYDVTITDTPIGDIESDLVISQTGDAYMVKMMSAQGTNTFENVQIVDKKLTGHFYYDGIPVNVETTFEGDSVKGMVKSEHGNFPITGMKKK